MSVRLFCCWESDHLLQSPPTQVGVLQRSELLFRGPDFFVVLGTESKPRKSWVVWEEGGKYPHVIVEILSESTATTDRELKKEIYQDIFRTPDYFWFSLYTQEFAGFHSQYRTKSWKSF